MNIFFLDEDTELCAQGHYDIHVSKMILETAQLLSTAHHLADSPVREMVYKMTHKNHPSSVWVRESKTHYEWLFDLFCELNKEFRHRRGKDHMSWVKLSKDLSSPPPGLTQAGWLRDPPQCMPDQYRRTDSVTAYRLYYTYGKNHLHSYTKRQVPSWMDENERMVYGTV
tara:strand:+ start:636 stop:1142 length:507 start_codon:yes stop_codon:yes gene_type:complete